MARVCILDYGSGNVRSVFNLFRGVCEHVIISNLVADIATATHLVLPGVGAFGAAMRRIGDTILSSAIIRCSSHSVNLEPRCEPWHD
jgi:imidazole glycerol-phosphate synthase subunit HisH